MAPTTFRHLLEKRQFGYGYGGYGGEYGNGSNFSEGGRIGAGVGAAVLLIFIMLLLCFCVRRRRRRNTSTITPAYPMDTQPTQTYNQGYYTNEGANAAYYNGAPQQEPQMTGIANHTSTFQGYPPAANGNDYMPPSSPYPTQQDEYAVPSLPPPTYRKEGDK